MVRRTRKRVREQFAVAMGMVMIAVVMLAVFGQLVGWSGADRSRDRQERLTECVEAGERYGVEFGWRPEEGVEAWCREMTGIEK